MLDGAPRATGRRLTGGRGPARGNAGVLGVAVEVTGGGVVAGGGELVVTGEVSLTGAVGVVWMGAVAEAGGV